MPPILTSAASVSDSRGASQSWHAAWWSGKDGCKGGGKEEGIGGEREGRVQKVWREDWRGRGWVMGCGGEGRWVGLRGGEG